MVINLYINNSEIQPSPKPITYWTSQIWTPYNFSAFSTWICFPSSSSWQVLETK